MSDTPAGRLSASSVTSLHFEPNSATLTHRGEVTLRGLIMQARVNGFLYLEVAGYASPTEPPERHQALSDERAQSVRSTLEQELRLGRNQVGCAGRGSASATGDPEKDRRAVVTLFR